MENIEQDLHDIVRAEVLRSVGEIDMKEEESYPQLDEILQSIIWKHVFPPSEDSSNSELSLSSSIKNQIEKKVSDSIPGSGTIEKYAKSLMEIGFTDHSIVAFIKDFAEKELLDATDNFDSMRLKELDSIEKYAKRLMEENTDKAFLKIEELEFVQEDVKALMEKRLTIDTETVDLLSSLDKDCYRKNLESVDSEEDNVSSQDADMKSCSADFNDTEMIDFLRGIELEDEYLLKQLLQSTMTSQAILNSLCSKPNRKDRRMNKKLDNKNNWLGQERLNDSASEVAENIVETVLRKGTNETTTEENRSVCSELGLELYKNHVKTEIIGNTHNVRKNKKNRTCGDTSKLINTLQESTLYKKEMKLKQIKLAAKEAEQKILSDELEAERKRKLKILQRLQYGDQACQSYADVSLQLMTEIDEISTQSELKWEQKVRDEEMRFVKYSLPTFLSVFEKWCYAKQCEHFLNQMSPVPWRMMKDHIFDHQFNRLSDQEKSHMVSANNLLVPPLEYVHYRTILQEDSTIINNHKNLYETFKRDLENRGKYVPVERPYFKSSSQFLERLERIEECYLQSLNVFVGIQRKEHSERDINQTLRQKKELIEKEVQDLEEQLLNEREKLHRVQCEILGTQNEVLYEHTMKKLLNKGKIIGKETKKEFTKGYNPEKCYTMDCIADTMLDDLMKMVYLFQMNEKNINLKKKRLEAKMNQTSARTMCRWVQVLQHVKENKMKIDRCSHVEVTQAYKPREKPFMFRSAPDHLQGKEILPCILENIKL